MPSSAIRSRGARRRWVPVRLRTALTSPAGSRPRPPTHPTLIAARYPPSPSLAKPCAPRTAGTSWMIRA